MAKAKVSGAEVPEGWARVLASTKDEDGEWVFEASAGGKVVAKVHGLVYVNVPVTPEAQAVAMAGAGTKFVLGPDGEAIAVEGPAGPAARKYYADRLEPVRGEYRKAGEEGSQWTLETLQAELDSYEPYNGRGGSRSKKIEITRDEFDAMSKEDLRELFRKSGAVKITK